MDRHDDLVVALTPLIDVLERLGVAWYVGGSVASTVHGRFRATNDIDLIANLREEHASPLRAALEAEHYIDEESVCDAVRHESNFNLVHYGTGLKIDVFIAADTEYETGVRARRVSEPIGDGANARRLWVASAEDTILAKLAWYRCGGGASQRQWRDVQGVIELRGQALDVEYLRRWAPPERLVVRGPYRHVRNPMITGVLLMLGAESLLFGSWHLAGWMLVFFAGNSFYLPLVEERALERRFGDDYRFYKANVPRWIPRWRAWDGIDR